MTGSERRVGPMRVDNGLIVVPISDVHANDGLPRMNSAAVGQQRKLSSTLQFGSRLDRGLSPR
jgi:hypothetical protein